MYVCIHEAQDRDQCMVDFCEHGNEPLDTTKDKEFLD
jgi:hypothetical protein